MDNNELVFEGKYLNWKRIRLFRGNNISRSVVKWKKYGKGKEYYWNGRLNFEGVYLNDKKVGKEYYGDGKIKFKGEYINDNKWNGKYYNNAGKIEYEIKNGNWNGKYYDYDYDGKLIFVGEYKEGKRWKGKENEYNYYGRLIFEGRCLDGEKWKGIGKEYYNNYKFLKLEGEYLNGKRNGKGKEYDDIC